MWNSFILFHSLTLTLNSITRCKTFAITSFSGNFPQYHRWIASFVSRIVVISVPQYHPWITSIVSRIVVISVNRVLRDSSVNRDFHKLAEIGNNVNFGKWVWEAFASGISSGNSSSIALCVWLGNSLTQSDRPLPQWALNPGPQPFGSEAPALWAIEACVTWEIQDLLVVMLYWFYQNYLSTKLKWCRNKRQFKDISQVTHALIAQRAQH